MRCQWTIDELKKNVWQSEIVKEYLKTPGLVKWPTDIQQLKDVLSFLATRCNLKDITSLIPHSLLAALLHDPEKYDAIWKSIDELNIPPSLLFHSVSLEDARSGFWQPAPVVTVLRNHYNGAYIHWFLVGRLPESNNSTSLWPDWFKSAGEEFKSAIKTAFDAAKKEEGKETAQLYTFPLVAPENVKNLDGGSVGLPMAMAAVAVLRNESIPSCFAATGNIQDNGEVGKVTIDTLKTKAAHVANSKSNFKLFLYPQDNNNFTEKPENIETRTVETLADALIWSKKYDPEKCREIEKLVFSLKDVNCFVNSCLEFQDDTLCWIKTSGKFNELWEEMKTPGNKCFSILCDKLNSCAKNYATHGNQADALGGLITLNDIDTVPPEFWFEHFRWCSINGGIANHSGNNQLRKEWYEKAIRFEKEVSEQEPDEYARFVIKNYLVGDRHNAYKFWSGNCDLPSEFVEIFKRLKQAYFYKGGSDRCVGTLYSVVAVDYAFAGRLNKVKWYTQKAQDAFGDRFVEDSQRSMSNLIGAYIDAGQLENACVCLQKYLDIQQENLESCWEVVEKKYPDYHGHESHLTVRLLTELYKTEGFEKEKTSTTGLVDVIFKTFEACAETKQPGKHPWQLWSYNVGKLALIQSRRESDNQTNYLDLGCKALEKSFELCSVPKKSETIYVMQLLPLSELFVNGLLGKDKLNQVKNIITLIQQSISLYKPHFADLLSLHDSQEILREVRENAKKYFPFNYR